MGAERRPVGQALWVALLLAAAAAVPVRCQEPEPLVYTLRAPAPETGMLEVEVSVPTDGQNVVELMMPTWSPGYYRVEDYAGKVRGLEARDPDGRALAVEWSPPNRWRVAAPGVPRVTVRYGLLCAQRSVTTNWVSADVAVLNGAATFVTLAGGPTRPHEVRLEAAPGWPRTMSGLPGAPDGRPDHFRARSYDELIDAPILAGDLDIHAFDVAGVPHYLVDVGERGGWDGAQAAADLRRIVAETLPLWGALPYDRYVFLNVFRPGGGGLEHANSTLLTANAERVATASGYLRWLEFVAHEYFHAFNVKRLRPVELGPFDYERGPRTPSLWISEGVTSYFGDLFVARAGLNDAAGFLASLSGAVRELQGSPGRLLQTVEQSSLEVWSNSNSGVGAAATTVSYYVKGQVMGFLLDARIRHLTDGRRSLEDVMRSAYGRFGGERGFTPEEFQAAAGEVAGADLGDWFDAAARSTEELQYKEALDWFGLRFSDDGRWELEVDPGATDAQRRHLAVLLSSAGEP